MINNNRRFLQLLIFFISIVLMIWATVASWHGIKRYGLALPPIMPCLYLGAFSLIISIANAVLFKSYRLSGYNFLLWAASIYSIIISHYMQYGKLVEGDKRFPLWIIVVSALFLTSEILLVLSKSNEWKWSLSVTIPCIIAATVYTIMIRNHPSLWLIITSMLVFMIAGLVLLSIMNTDKWKWYISAFIPCIIVAGIYLHIFWNIPYLYFVVIWLWYYVFKKAPTNSLVNNICILLPLAVFLSKTIFRIMEYFRLNGIIDNIGLSVGIIVNSERIRASVEIPPEILAEQQCHLYSAMFLFISIILYSLLEKRLFSDLFRPRFRGSAIEQGQSDCEN